MAEPVELIGGPEVRAIEICEPDPAWVRRFALQAEAIRWCLGPSALRVDHVGSTAVASLAAKPIIDIQLSVLDCADETAYVPPLVGAGYRLRVREPGHRLLRTQERDVHLHVCDAGGDWERRHLLFRDWLRRDAADRRRYEDCKRRLAAQDWPSMQAYADAKGGTIAVITRRAEAWARSCGWCP